MSNTKAKSPVASFVSLPAGSIFLRTDSHGEVDKCIKLASPNGLWNSVYIDGKYAGSFCSTGDDVQVEWV